MSPRHVVTALFLVAALVCYVVGLVDTAIGFFLIGSCFEAVFWMRIYRSYKQTSPEVKS